VLHVSARYTNPSRSEGFSMSIIDE
jgi:hypothetical protein